MPFPKALDGNTAIIHHKALNTQENLQASLRIAAEYKDHVHVFEGDLCWHNYPGQAQTDFYFFHQRLFFDDLSPKARTAWIASGKSLDFEPTLRELPENVLAIIELKLGRGNTEMAFKDMLSVLDKAMPGRFWIDGFDIKQLRLVKSLSPSTPVSVHTERIIGEKILTTIPRAPFLYKTHIDDLDWLDGISVRHWENFESMDAAAKLVQSRGKTFFMSRIHTEKRWQQTQKLSASGGYFEMEDIPKLISDISV